MNRTMNDAELYELVKSPWWDGARPEHAEYDGFTFVDYEHKPTRIRDAHAIMLHEAAAVRALLEPAETIQLSGQSDGAVYAWWQEESAAAHPTLLHALDAALKARWEAQR